jgi:hypothetical protein
MRVCIVRCTQVKLAIKRDFLPSRAGWHRARGCPAWLWFRTPPPHRPGPPHRLVHIHMQMHINIHMCTYTHTHIHMRIHTYAYTYTHTHTHTHTLTYTHAHAPPRAATSHGTTLCVCVYVCVSMCPLHSLTYLRRPRISQQCTRAG